MTAACKWFPTQVDALMDFFKHLWCRVAYGHIMIPYGNDSKLMDGKMGAETVLHGTCVPRCLLCQRLNCIGRDKEAE